MPIPPISKSRYLEGLQCPKLLWFRYNAKDQFPPIDPSTQAIFDQGHLVGNYAKQLFPRGIEIAAKPWEYPKIEAITRESLGHGVPIFEAGFAFQQAFARCDILNPSERGGWDLIEVKSATKVKDVNFDDVAIQLFICRGAGLSINRCFVYVVNNQYVRRGDIDPQGLFTSVDVTKEAVARQADVPKHLAAMQSMIRKRSHPDIPIGPHCSDPYECMLMDLCWNDLPGHSVFTLYRSRRSFEWFEEGIVKLIDIPLETNFTETQEIQLETVRNGRPHVDRKVLREFLGGLRYPLYLLDFETFNTAIPLYDGVRPYQKIPFQYSLHVLHSEGEKPKHFSYLADGSTDPRPGILTNLKKLLGSAGSILCYNASFEKGVLRESSEMYPAYAPWHSTLEARIIDLYEPFRNFAFYHPDQRGSASLKAVLPVLTGETYEGMPIADGDTASREYLRVTFGDVKPSERARVRKQLEEYCGFDTQAMIGILKRLYTLTQQQVAAI